MRQARRSFGRRALFAATDPRTMGTLLVGLTGFFVVSLATGARTAVAYPWNAPDARLTAEPERAPVTASDKSVAEAADAAAEAAADAVTEEVSAPGTSLPSADEAPATNTEPTATEALDPETPESVPSDPVAPSPEEARTPPPAGKPTVETITRPPDTRPAAETPEVAAPRPVDLGPTIAALETAEAAIAQDRWQDAADALRRVHRATAGIEAPELRPGGVLHARIAAAEDDVALLEFEENILAAIQVARGAQESGDYPAAIGALEGLVARADGAAADRARRMFERLDFWQVAATARNLLEACEFERTNLGRTAPCRNR